MKAGWEVKRLGDVCDLIGGGTPSKKIKQYYGGNIPWVTVRDMNVETVETTEHTITELGLKNSSSKIIPKGEIIIASRVGLGKICKLAQKMAINQDLKGVVPKQSILIDRQFLYYWLQSIATHIEKNGVGATVKGVKLNFLNNLKIPLPPLTEQKQIVAVLDAAFEGLNRATQHAKANLQNARELFEAQLKEQFEQTPKDWVHTKLENICSKIGSGSTPKGGKSAYKREGISLVRSLNIHDRNFKHKQLAFIDSLQADRLSNVILEADDVLLNITGASVTRCALVDNSILPARVNQHVSIIRPFKNKLNPKFLCYLLTSEPYKKTLLKIGNENGATREAITKAHIQTLVVSYPNNLIEQKNICNNLSNAENNTKALESHYQAKLDDIANLRQSLLQKAFAGELT